MINPRARFWRLQPPHCPPIVTDEAEIRRYHVKQRMAATKELKKLATFLRNDWDIPRHRVHVSGLTKGKTSSTGWESAHQLPSGEICRRAVLNTPESRERSVLWLAASWGYYLAKVTPHRNPDYVEKMIRRQILVRYLAADEWEINCRNRIGVSVWCDWYEEHGGDEIVRKTMRLDE